MEIKRGISLVILAITIVVMVILTGIIIAGINNAIFDVQRNDFIVELQTIENTIKEYNMLIGKLPVKQDVEYTYAQIAGKIIDAHDKDLLEVEVAINGDKESMFYVVDVDLLKIETRERGKLKDDTDVFVVAADTLTVYYLGGFEIDGTNTFSLATLTIKNDIGDFPQYEEQEAEIKEQLVLTKNTNAWTNEIKITVKNKLKDNETLEYSIAGLDAKSLGTSNVITINAANMTDDEKEAFKTNKKVAVGRLLDGSVKEKQVISVENLDVISPQLGDLEMLEADSTEYNKIKINYEDDGGSGIKCLYYDYYTKMVTLSSENVVESYYTDVINMGEKELITYGRATNDGVVTLDKNIHSISVIAVDNANNVSGVKTYTITEEYVIAN